MSETTTEEDLWELDDNLQDVTAASVKKSKFRSMPSPQESPHSEVDDVDIPAENRVRLNVSRVPFQAKSSETGLDASIPTATFDDLESLDESIRVENPIEIRPLPELSVPEPNQIVADEESSFKKIASHESVVAKSESLSPIGKRGYSAIEKLGMALLSAVLLLAGALAYWFSIQRLPEDAIGRKVPDLPVKGQYLTIQSVESYWREPKLQGEILDPVVRGTKLIPEIVITPSQGSGTIQVRFFDDQGDPRGDTITRSVSGTAPIPVAATEGFDDLGRYAEYRTTDRTYWRVEVFEGVAGASSGDQFSQLFTMDVSADRR